jgi:hypothetical protein
MLATDSPDLRNFTSGAVTSRLNQSLQPIRTNSLPEL